MQPMISHDFHGWWVSRRTDYLITHGPTDVGRSARFFQCSWGGRHRLGIPMSYVGIRGSLGTQKKHIFPVDRVPMTSESGDIRVVIVD